MSDTNSLTQAADPAVIKAFADAMRTRSVLMKQIAVELRYTSAPLDGGGEDAAIQALSSRCDESARNLASAAQALELYAWAAHRGLAQSQWCEAETQRAGELTETARQVYHDDVVQAFTEQAQWEAEHGEGSFPVVVLPFIDPGLGARNRAHMVLTFSESDLDAAAQVCTERFNSLIEEFDQK